jgi:hypothetical protein
VESNDGWRTLSSSIALEVDERDTFSTRHKLSGRTGTEPRLSRAFEVTWDCKRADCFMIQEKQIADSQGGVVLSPLFGWWMHWRLRFVGSLCWRHLWIELNEEDIVPWCQGAFAWLERMEGMEMRKDGEGLDWVHQRATKFVSLIT